MYIVVSEDHKILYENDKGFKLDGTGAENVLGNYIVKRFPTVCSVMDFITENSKYFQDNINGNIIIVPVENEHNQYVKVIFSSF